MSIGPTPETRQSHTIEYGVRKIVPEGHREGYKNPAVDFYVQTYKFFMSKQDFYDFKQCKLWQKLSHLNNEQKKLMFSNNDEMQCIIYSA